MPDGPPLAAPRYRPALAVMADEELRYDALPPHLWRRPATLHDIERKIATMESQLRAIDTRIAEGRDRAYWLDCRIRAEQQLAIYREAHSTLVTEGLRHAAPRPEGSAQIDEPERTALTEVA